MIFFSLFPFLLWAALVVAQIPNIDRADHVNHAVKNTPRRSLIPAFALKQPPVTPPALGVYTSQGCFGELPSQFVYFKRTKMTPNWCYRQCKDRQHGVMLMNANQCFCSDKYPTEKSLLPEERCIFTCSGKPYWVCGGPGAYTVYNLGIKLDIEHEPSPPPRSQGTVAATEQRPNRLATSSQRVSQHCFNQLPKSAVRVPWPARGTRDFLKICTDLCRIRRKTVAIIRSSECHCATTYPPKTALVDDDSCDIPCRGRPGYMCGGRSFMWTAHLTGLSEKVKHEAGTVDGPSKQSP